MRGYSVDGKSFDGRGLVAYANRLFTSQEHGRGRYGRPHTIDGAIQFLERDLGRRVYVKMVNLNLRKLNKELERKNIEVTRYKGKYHVLHISKHSGTPIPLFIDEDAEKTREYIESLR